MLARYPLFIGLRYAASKTRSQLVSFISLISMLGMAVGVALLILVLSVMNGFDEEMRTRILGLVPQITVSAYGDGQAWQAIEQTIMQHPEVVAVAPFAQVQAMLLRGTTVESVQVFGIDPEREKAVSIIDQYADDEVLAALSEQPKSIVLGAALATRLGVAVGDALNIMVPQQTDSGRISPRFSRLRVLGVFDTGTEIDQSVALMGINHALALMPSDSRIQGLRVSVNDTFEAARIGWELEQNIPYGYITRDWTQTHGNLYSAIQLSKQLVGLMLVTIIAVAAFNVVSALVMIVTDKRGDIAILRTMGASSAGVMLIFVMQGVVIALIGTAVGTLAGAGLSLVVTGGVAGLESLFNIQFLNSDVYPVDYLPADLRLRDVLQVCGTAFLMSILATLYPAWRASRVAPAEALRYE